MNAVMNDMNAAEGGEWVAVAIGEQQFAIDIQSVLEIRGWAASTPMPHAPPYVMGLINLRGAILPVVDLSARLGLGGAEIANSSVVVVAQIDGRQIGLLVDAVCDILHIREEEVRPAPDIGSARTLEFVQGVVSIDGVIVSLLSLASIAPPEAAAA